MPIQYKIVTSVLALTGCTSLLMTGWMNLVICSGGLSVFIGYYRFFKDLPQASKRAAAILAQAALVLFIVDAIISRDIFLAVANLTIVFQGIKSFDLKEPWDHLQVYFMSLLQLIIASELTSSLAFGAIFMIFMVLLVTAMVLSHFLKEGSLGKVSITRPVAVIVVLTMVSTIVIFVALPRTPYRSIGKSHVRGMKTVGFSEKVDFGSFGDIKLDPAVVMRVEFEKEISPPYYWRGMALDYFDGRSWRNTSGTRYRVHKVSDLFQLAPYTRSDAVVQSIFLEPIDSNVMFGLPVIAAVSAELPYIGIDADTAIYTPIRLSRRIKYTVFSDISSAEEGKSDRRYLQLPPGMERVADLAERVAGTAGADLQKAVAVEAYFGSGYTYSLSTSEPPAGMNIIDDFLFNSRKGYCEHYASSMVLMLRTLGLPARVVTGFSTGERNEYGNYVIVRQRDAHAWVETLIDGRWQRFDPTPAVAAQKQNALELYLDSLRMRWMRYVIGFSFDDQKAIARLFTIPFHMNELPSMNLKNLRIASLLLVLVPTFFLAVRLVLLRHRNRMSRVTMIYLKFIASCRRLGVDIKDSTTSGEVRSALNNLSGKSEAEEFLQLYEAYRFGNRQMPPNVMKRYQELLKIFRYSGNKKGHQ